MKHKIHWHYFRLFTSYLDLLNIYIDRINSLLTLKYQHFF